MGDVSVGGAALAIIVSLLSVTIADYFAERRLVLQRKLEAIDKLYASLIALDFAIARADRRGANSAELHAATASEEQQFVHNKALCTIYLDRPAQQLMSRVLSTFRLRICVMRWRIELAHDQALATIRASGFKLEDSEQTVRAGRAALARLLKVDPLAPPE